MINSTKEILTIVIRNKVLKREQKGEKGRRTVLPQVYCIK